MKSPKALTNRAALFEEGASRITVTSVTALSTRQLPVVDVTLVTTLAYHMRQALALACAVFALVQECLVRAQYVAHTS